MPPQNCPSHPPPQPPLGQHLLPSPGLLQPLQAACSPPARIPQIKIPACWFPALLVSQLCWYSFRVPCSPRGTLGQPRSPALFTGPLHQPSSPATPTLGGSTTPKPLFSPDFSPKSRTHTHKGPLNISGCTQTQPGLCWNLLPPLRHCCTQSPPRTPARKGAELTPPAPWHALSPMPGAKHSPISFSVLQSVETALKDKVDQTAQGQGPLGCGPKLFSDPLPWDLTFNPQTLHEEEWGQYEWGQTHGSRIQPSQTGSCLSGEVRVFLDVFSWH